MIWKKPAFQRSAYLKLQRILETTAMAVESMMGIGMGASPDSSGEVAILRRLREHHPREQQLCVFDVGANQGQFLSVVERELATFPSVIHVFEPGRVAFEALSANARRFTNVVLNNTGLGSRPGESILYYDRPGSGLASFAKRRLDHFGIEFEQSEIVQVGTLDDYCARKGIACIHLLKLDVEGSELDVLRGGLGMFEHKSVETVTFEFGGCNIDTRTYFQDFWYFFMSVGMKYVYRIIPSGYLFPIVRYQEIHERFRTTNYVASLSALNDEGA
jgi:FkbM family methyltransferase